MKCPDCGDEFELSKPDGDDAMLPWFLDVFHDHTETPQKWVGVVYQHAKGQRYPKQLKEIVEKRKAQKASVLAAKRAAPSKPTCPMHPEGCLHE
jgi:hypothetical protein